MTATPQELAHYLKCKGGEAGEGLLVMKNWSTFYRNATDGTWHHLASLGLLFQGVPTGIGSTQNAAGLFPTQHVG